MAGAILPFLMSGTGQAITGAALGGIGSLIGGKSKRRARQATEAAAGRLESMATAGPAVPSYLTEAIQQRVQTGASIADLNALRAAEEMQRRRLGARQTEEAGQTTRQLARLGSLGGPAAQARLFKLARARAQEGEEQETGLRAQEVGTRTALTTSGIGAGLQAAGLEQQAQQQRAALLERAAQMRAGAQDTTGGDIAGLGGQLLGMGIGTYGREQEAKRQENADREYNRMMRELYGQPPGNSGRPVSSTGMGTMFGSSVPSVRRTRKYRIE